MPHENAPLSRSTPGPCTAGRLTAAPLLAIRGAGAPVSAGSSIVTDRPVAGTIAIPFTVTGRSEW